MRKKTALISCACCGKEMANLANKGLQPKGGLAFSTHGHYGSGYFDPMDGSYLEIAICDECIEKLERGGDVFRSSARLAGAPRR